MLIGGQHRYHQIARYKAGRKRADIIGTDVRCQITRGVFGLGDRVFHQKFGYGAVIDIEGDKLSVLFDKAGEKKVVSSYVNGVDDIPF